MGTWAEVHACAKLGALSNEECKAFRLNAYRVLLTRARAGLAIFVPIGDGEDPTRNPQEFEAVFGAPVKAGCERL